MNRNPFFFLVIISLLFLYGCRKDVLEVQLIEQESGTSSFLHAVDFVNDSVGYVSGGERFSQSLILQTTNAGQTWNPLEIETEKVIFSLDAYDEERFIAGDFNGMIIFAEEQGQSFTTQVTDEWNPVRALQYFDPVTIYAAGGVGFDNGYIHYVNDEFRWDHHYFESEFRDIHFLNPQHGFVCGFGVLMETRDAARSWSIIPDVDGDFFTAMDFPTDQIAYLVGYNGSVRKSIDSGQTWEKIFRGNHPFERQNHFNACDFINPEVGIIVGDNGLAFKTNNAGKDWSRIKGFSKADLRGVKMTSESSGFIVGGEGKIFRFEE